MSDDEAAPEVDVAPKPGIRPEVLEKARKLAAADDDRAMAGIKRGKGMGGMGGFAVAAAAAYMHGELITSVLLRGLLGGIVGYMVGWLAAVTVWRRIIRAELERSVEAALAARRAAASQVEAQ